MDVKTADCLPIADPNDRAAYAGWLLIAGQHRDSDALERSNYLVAFDELDRIDPECADHVELYFGHYAVGWIEELAVRPGTAAAAAGQRILARLETYPILDEDRYYALEWEDNHPTERECYADDDDCPCDARQKMRRRAHLLALLRG